MFFSLRCGGGGGVDCHSHIRSSSTGYVRDRRTDGKRVHEIKHPDLVDELSSLIFIYFLLLTSLPFALTTSRLLDDSCSILSTTLEP